MKRKLIKPSPNEVKNLKRKKGGKKHPPYRTYSENYYYSKQKKEKNSMIFVLSDGEKIKGYIQWYDEKVIKIIRKDLPNLVVFKNSIKYIMKDEKQKIK